VSNVYVAASFPWKRVANGFADLLRNTGFGITSSWLDAPEVSDADLDAAGRLRVVQQCLADVARADCLVVLSYLGEPRMTWVELGVALASGKPIVLVVLGDVGRCVIDAHPRVVVLDLEKSVEEAIRVYRDGAFITREALPSRLHDAVREALGR
jgi:nucleoside 2-deoxyribosyltransferase